MSVTKRVKSCPFWRGHDFPLEERIHFHMYSPDGRVATWRGAVCRECSKLIHFNPPWDTGSYSSPASFQKVGAVEGWHNERIKLPREDSQEIAFEPYRNRLRRRW